MALLKTNHSLQKQLIKKKGCKPLIFRKSMTTNMSVNHCKLTVNLYNINSQNLKAMVYRFTIRSGRFLYK